MFLGLSRLSSRRKAEEGSYHELPTQRSVSKKPHPEALDEVNAIKTNPEIEGFVTELSHEIEEERSNRKVWENAVERLNRMRFGARRRKTHPWPGAANYVIPVIDSKIEQVKPLYVNLAFGVSPIVTFVPFGPEDVDPARKREDLFDWRMRTQVNFFEPYTIGVDQVLGANGMTVFRIIWKFSSRTYTVNLDINELPQELQNALFDVRVNDELLERAITEFYKVDLSYEENEREIERAIESFRNGETSIELTFFEDKDDRPEVTACDVSQDIVVPFETKDINDARFVDYKFWVSKNDLKITIKDGKYTKFPDADIDSWSGKSSEGAQGFGQSVKKDPSDEMVLLHETCCWYDVNGDGIEERCIATWPDASPSSILRFIELPYEHGQWPYVQVKRELISTWFYATRGYPSLDEDFQTGISTAVNQAIDNGTLLNMPERVARKGVLSNPRNRRWLPGEFTETNGPTSDYETRVFSNVSQPGLFQQAQFLKSWSDQRSGNIGSAFSGSTDMPGLGERGKKTKAEVDQIALEKGQAASLDLQVFQNQMAKVYYQIDALYDQYGADEEFIALTGREPTRVSREEIQGRFNRVPNGRLDNATPQDRLRKKMFAFNIGFGNPFVKQYELLKEIYEDIDPRLAQLVVKSVEEISAEQEQQQRLAEVGEVTNINKAAGIKKLMDDLDIRKEALLVPITGKKHAPD